MMTAVETALYDDVSRRMPIWQVTLRKPVSSLNSKSKFATTLILDIWNKQHNQSLLQTWNLILKFENLVQVCHRLIFDIWWDKMRLNKNQVCSKVFCLLFRYCLCVFLMWLVSVLATRKQDERNNCPFVNKWPEIKYY